MHNIIGFSSVLLGDESLWIWGKSSETCVLPWYYSRSGGLGTYANAKIGIVYTMGRGGGEVSNQ